METTQIIQVCLGLLSKNLLNQQSVFQMKDELSVTFFIRLLSLNADTFKKVQIVKDVISPILDSIMLQNCEDLSQMRELQQLWTQNTNMLVQ